MNRWAATPLLLLLPFIWQAGYWLGRRATREARLAKVLAPGLALALWLLAIHALGLATHSFFVGLFAGTIAVAGFGSWSLRRSRRPLSPASTPRPTVRAFPPWAWIALPIAIAVIAGPELRWSEHDECLVTGHVSLPLQMQNGIYPPRYSTFPQFEVRYHYGVDLAAAVSSSLLGNLEMQATVHLLAVALWTYSFLLLWMVGEQFLGGAAAGPVTAFGVLLAGGAPFFCRGLRPLGLFLMSDCAPGGTWITPPLISNFLQHPWSLGIPLFLGILLLLPLNESQGKNPWWWLAFSLLFALLSFAQVVLFACLLPTVVVVLSLHGTQRLRRSLIFTAWAVGILVTAVLLHGFFARGTEPQSGGIAFHPYWKDIPLGAWLSWNWDALGLLLPLGLAGFFFLPNSVFRWVLAILAAGGFLARNLLQYSHSWDIVKFSMVSQIALGLLTAALLARAISRPRTRALGVAGLLACTFFGFGWSAALTFDLPGLYFCRALTPRPPRADEQAIAFLRAHVRAGDGVFLNQYADAYAIYGGLPTPSWDWGVESFGFSHSLFEARRELVDHPTRQLEPYLSQSFRWMVVRDTDRLLQSNAAAWVQDGQAELAAEFPPLRVYRLLTGPPGQS